LGYLCDPKAALSTGVQRACSKLEYARASARDAEEADQQRLLVSLPKSGGAVCGLLVVPDRLEETTSMSNNVPENAMFVCFGGLSNVGTLTGLAALEVERRLGLDKAGIFCLGGLPTESRSVLDKTRAAKRIITVDGCPLNCARKIVEAAGFTPDRIINLVEDCWLKKGPPLEYSDEDLQVAVEAILAAAQELD
jgi:uncharacterized metal-binding protein